MSDGVRVPLPMVHALILKQFKTALKSAMELAGFKFELRRAGELQLGLWRKPLRRSKGIAKRLVVLPGFGDSPLSWVPVISLLSPVTRRQFDEVIFLDYPGFSGWLSDDRPFSSMDLLIQSVGDVLDELRPHTLLGHSMGSWLVGHYTADCGSGARPRVTRTGSYAGPVRSLLVCPTGMFESEQARVHWEHKFRRAQDGGFAAFRREIFAREPFWFGFFLPDLERFMKREETLQFMNSVEERHLLQDKLAQVRADMWLIYGEKDDLSPTRSADAWSDAIIASGKRANVVVIQGAGHTPQIEKLPATAAVLGQILVGRAPVKRATRWYLHWQARPSTP